MPIGPIRLAKKSGSQMVSFFAKEENIDLKELEEILKRADEARRSEN